MNGTQWKGLKKKAEQRRKVLYKRGGRRKKKASPSSQERPVVSRPSQRCACLSVVFLNNVRVRSKSQTEPQVTFMLHTPSLSLSRGSCDARASRQKYSLGMECCGVRRGCEQQEAAGLVPVKLHVTTDSQFSIQTVLLEAACCFALNTLWSNCSATKKHYWYQDKG